MRLWMALLAMVPACGFHSSGGGGDDGSGTPDAPMCFGSFVPICFTSLGDVPTTQVMQTDDLIIDTGSSPMCDQHNDHKDAFCVIAGAGFTLSANKTIRAYGTKPLVLLSTSTLALEGQSTVDVSSNRMANPQATGAGANPATCTNDTRAMQAGGGFGGSFGGKGGDGERLSGAPATSGNAAPVLNAPPTQLRGGCPGGDGDVGGLGGSGGGAVALIAAASIQVDGTINASGAGGHGGPATQSGGGGGGSGGMIVLDAPSIMATGTLFANGGGGGQGGTGGTPPAMGIGADGGESSAPPTPAPGGNDTSTTGGSGGTGSAGIRLEGNNGGSTISIGDGGGGGGGGGAGFIRAHGVMMNIAPPSSVP